MPPTATLGDLLDHRVTGLPGRDEERAALLDLVRRDRPLVVALHGIAGSGKTAVLRAFADDARAEGAAVVVLEGASIEPTPSGFRRALETATGGRALGSLGARVVLVIDGYEHLGMLDAWLVRSFLGGLPAHVRLLLCGRHRPSSLWAASCGGALRAMRLGGLPTPVAERLLEDAGVDPNFDRIAHGHPLTLQLAISAARDRPAIPFADLAVSAVEDVARVYLDGLGEATWRAVTAASVTRRTTLSLLQAQLPDEPARDAFERLRALPFVELVTDGLVLHDTLRATAATLLRATDPATHRAYREAAWRQLRDELHAASGRDLWRCTADLLYLVDQPIVQQFFFPATLLDCSMEAATAGDWPVIARLAAGEQDVDMTHVEDWWRAMPEAFSVVRDACGEVLGFRCMAERNAIPAAIYAADPVAARFRGHLRADPVPAGATATILRYIAIRDSRDAPTLAHAALLLDTQRRCVELRPHLRRTYATEPLLLGAQGRCAMTLGYVPMPGEPPGLSCAERLLYNDYGPGSIDGWLVDLAARELGLEPQSPVDPVLRRLALDGARVDLTQLEFDVLRYLHEHEGQAVSRASLLRDVWGYRWSGGSNVVEVAISGLRKKLGDRASSLRTVRGVGYRLDPLP